MPCVNFFNEHNAKNPNKKLPNDWLISGRPPFRLVVLMACSSGTTDDERCRATIDAFIANFPAKAYIGTYMPVGVTVSGPKPHVVTCYLKNLAKRLTRNPPLYPKGMEVAMAMGEAWKDTKAEDFEEIDGFPPTITRAPDVGNVFIDEGK